MDSMETVCRAIDAFYSGGPDVQPAQQFLQEFQESTESWTICDQIIRLHSNSLACYFAAQTLRTKILKKFQQLPPDQYEALRQSLLQHLDRHGATAHDAQSEATATQLCLAIADLYIQVPTWNSWIFELLHQCQSLEGDRTIMTLTLLQVFPEEVENIRGIGENRRIAIREELAGCEQPMITFMTHVLEKFHTNTDVLKRVFKCLESNLQNHQMRTDHFASSPLISSVFHVIATISPEVPSCLHEAATNCIVAALYRVEEIDAHRRLAEVIHRGVLSLVGPFQKAQQEEDFDRLQNIARIFVELVESFFVQIVNEANVDPNSVGSLACFELLLLVAGHHDWALIEMSFNVWYRITEELFKYDDDQYIGRFRPYAERFIMCLYEHCKIEPDDVDEALDEYTEFADFRRRAVEALRDVVFIVNSDKCIQMMHQKLIECCHKPNASWEESESALFVMAAVVQNLLPESESSMPEVLQLVCSLPVRSPPSLIATSLSLISDLNDWFEQHSNLLEPVIRWILQFAADTRFACHVATCFDRIALKCPVQMTPLLPQLLSLIGVLEQTQTNALKIEESICSLTRACSTIIARLPPAESKVAMEQLCEPIIRNLQRATEAADATIANNNNGSSATGGGGANKENEGATKSQSIHDQAWASISMKPMVWIDRVAYVFKGRF
ncbi:CBN-TSR-1 protein [Caenorhabditis brenneri]|uniref:CBN-TSR-1 protein n=1 Tax=Caenorhabditis brenneri TaxID=135651 RepID=G0NIN5_CAEBE|nr:CBN-TSR-1 protein [Caenorhabditis brenneri]